MIAMQQILDHIDVQIVAEIAPEKSGKFRYVVSKVAMAAYDPGA